MFDRLVCASLTMTTEQAIEKFGEDHVKDIEKTKPFSNTLEYKEIVKNHLEGKVGAFLIHGDDGANDYTDREMPKAYNKYDIGDFNNPKNCILPIVWQCRYMGIDVPEKFITSFYMNEGISYSEANDRFEEKKLKNFKQRADKLIQDTCDYIKNDNKI
jgi:hypothetical protein